MTETPSDVIGRLTANPESATPDDVRTLLQALEDTEDEVRAVSGLLRESNKVAARTERTMTTEVRKAWDALERAHGRVEGAMAVMLTLKQPELAEARKIVIGYIEKCGEAFAALERAWMASEKGLPENAKALNRSFWTWAMTALQVVRA